MKRPKVRELGEALRSLTSAPFTTKYPFAPAEVQKEFRGKPIFIEENCIVCGACAEVCPSNAIEVEEYKKDDKMYRVLIRDYGKCIFCGECLAHCTTQDGIEFTNEFEMASLSKEDFFERIEDKLVLCEICGKPITTEKHLDWLEKKLGEKAFANQSIIIQRAIELGLIDEEPADKEARERFLREDFYRRLCPACRASMFLKEDWG